MPRFIKQTFTVLVLLLLGFSGSLTTKCISLNKQSQRTRLTLTDVNPHELYYDPFIVILDRLDGSCNTAEDAFCRICLSNNTENTNLKVFSMIKGIKDSKKLKNIFHVNQVAYLTLENVTRNKNGITISASVGAKNKKNCICETVFTTGDSFHNGTTKLCYQQLY